MADDAEDRKIHAGKNKSDHHDPRRRRHIECSKIPTQVDCHPERSMSERKAKLMESRRTPPRSPLPGSPRGISEIYRGEPVIPPATRARHTPSTQPSRCAPLHL